MRRPFNCAIWVVLCVGSLAMGCGEDPATPLPVTVVHIRTSLAVPVTQAVIAAGDECFGAPEVGNITSGDLTLAGVTAQLIFRNNVKGTHESIEDVLVDAEILPSGARTAFNCVAGIDSAAFAAGLPSGADILITFGDCSNADGPYIQVEGEIRLGDTDSVVILPDGEAITFNKQPSAGGVGGNPYIYLRVVDDVGEPLTEEYFVGRCVQLSKPAK